MIIVDGHLSIVMGPARRLSVHVPLPILSVLSLRATKTYVRWRRSNTPLILDLSPPASAATGESLLDMPLGCHLVEWDKAHMRATVA